VAWATIGMAVPIAALAVAQFATHTIWWNDTLEQGNVYNRFFRVNGIFYDPNILGRYLMVALTIVVAYAVATNRRRDLLGLGLGAAVLAAGLVVTFSRSSALGLMVAVTLLAVRAFGWRRTLLVGVGALVLIGGPVVAVNSNVRDKVSSATGLASTGEGRFRLVSGGVKLWKTQPVQGVGLGAFAQEYRKTLPRKQEVKTRVFISHTAPITVLAELGVIGFALMLALLGVATGVLWRGSRRNPGAVGLGQWTILAILVGIFVHSLLYSAFFEDPYVWILAAIGVAVGAAQPVRVREAAPAVPVVVSAPG
jgi:O-antigen ligase